MKEEKDEMTDGTLNAPKPSEKKYLFVALKNGSEIVGRVYSDEELANLVSPKVLRSRNAICCGAPGVFFERMNAGSFDGDVGLEDTNDVFYVEADSLEEAEAATKDEESICSICGEAYEGFGNNAAPVAEGECCDDCNLQYVRPGRLKLHLLNNTKDSHP